MMPTFETYQRIHKAIATIESGVIDNLDCGRHELSDDSYVNIMEYDTKETGLYESHHHYIDIHYLIHGQEFMMIADETKLSITAPYDENGDCVLGSAAGEKFLVREKTPFVVMPGEAHLPGLKVDEAVRVKKAVVKVLL